MLDIWRYLYFDSRGINIRHLGEVRAFLRKNNFMKKLILTECCARTLKNMVSFISISI